MMLILLISAFIVTILPPAFLSVYALYKFTDNSRRVPLLICIGLISSFFVLAPHSDTFTGLDVAMYRIMTQSFINGRGLQDNDAAFAKVPEKVKPLLLYRSAVGTSARLTRDSVFELKNFPNSTTSPFFLPTLPLSAAGASNLGIDPELLVPIFAVLWIVCIFSVAWATGKGWGLVSTIALLYGTAWPSWFLRGFFPEAIGGVLIASVIVIAFNLKNCWHAYALYGLMLGLSLAFHPTLVLLMIPVALLLIARSGKIQETIALVIGGGVGTLPLFLINKYICQPYGDFTNLNSLIAMCSGSPEILAVTVALLVAALSGIAIIVMAHIKIVRNFFSNSSVCKIIILSSVAVCAVSLTLPFIMKGRLLSGFISMWSGIGFFAVTLLIALFFTAFSKNRSLSGSLLVAAFSVCLLLFSFIKGTEVHVGIWSQRRFAPIIFCLISILSVPLATGVRSVAIFNKQKGVLLVIILLAPAAAHFATSPAAYYLSNEKGAVQFADTVKAYIDETGNNALTVFDYYPHSVPYQANSSKAIFGISEHVAKRYELVDVVSWMKDVAESGNPVNIISSYTPVQSFVEEGLWFEMKAQESSLIKKTSTKSFLPLQVITNKITNTFYSGKLISEDNLASVVQMKKMDGSPFGLRPPWGRRARGGQWTMEGSGVSGPVPLPGGSVEITIVASWFPPEDVPDWTEQTIRITPPFTGDPIEFTVNGSAENAKVLSQTLKARSMRTADGEFLPFSGIYRINALTPYKPKEHDLEGFGENLGIVLDYIEIRVTD